MFFRQRFLVRSLYCFRTATFAEKQGLDLPPEAPAQPEKKGIDAKTFEYLQQRMKATQGRAILDKQNFRIDLGLLISRDPIFLTIEDKEMEGLKFRLKISKKYKLMLPIAKELTEFQEKDTPPSEGIDDLPTHEIVRPDGTRVTYSGNSKIYTKVDPEVMDNKSIQYAGAYRTHLMFKDKKTQKWVFPSINMTEKATFTNTKANLFSTVSNSKWEVVYPTHNPMCVAKRGLTDEEKKDPMNRRAVGVKTFYFPALHEQGKILINDELYDDYAWVTRLELNKYLDRETYTNMVNSILLY